MGVWIENILRVYGIVGICVTPCMGVWIENESFLIYRLCPLSLPVWECGLKTPYEPESTGMDGHTQYGRVE